MTIHASAVNVRLVRPRISGEILLHDDHTHTVVPVAIEPVDAPPWFEVVPPRGDTYRDDFDQHRHHAERIMRTLFTLAAEETEERDREVDGITRAFGAPRKELRDELEDDV